MSALTRRAAWALVVSIFIAGLSVGKATAAGTRLVYRTNDGGPRIVILGGGCLGAEDSAKLRLVEWTASRVTYRCVTP